MIEQSTETPTCSARALPSRTPAEPSEVHRFADKKHETADDTQEG